jgi:transcriptional regulator with XRE-family HTH domain
MAKKIKPYPGIPSLVGDHPVKTARAISSEWEAEFARSPDAMHVIISDFIKRVYAQPGKVGQRPMPESGKVDFYGLMYGEGNEDKIYDVMRRLMAKYSISERDLECLIDMSRSQIHRTLKGDYIPNVHEIRQIAVALKVTPTYFVEYRQAMVLVAFVKMITENPEIATNLYLKYLKTRIN